MLSGSVLNWPVRDPAYLVNGEGKATHEQNKRNQAEYEYCSVHQLRPRAATWK